MTNLRPGDPSSVDESIDLEELQLGVTEVLDAMAETMPVLLDNRPLPEGAVLEGKIEILGEVPGRAVLRSEERMAHRLAVAYSLVDPEEPKRQDALDAFSEFVNIVGGALKMGLDGESSLGLPDVRVRESGRAATSLLVVDHPIGWVEIDLSFSDLI